MLLPAGMFQPAWANSELHFGARLFFPLWDVRGPNRLTFIVIAREALTVGNSIKNVATGTANATWTVANDFDNCRPRGNGVGSNPFPSGIGNTDNVNRGSLASPRFDDDVHFEYYGKSCVFGNEVIHMSCSDVDLFVLDDANPRKGFNSVSFDGVGALDAHLIINGQTDPAWRKDENSLMGQAIISDLAEGWVAAYVAAAAKSTTCSLCNALDGGTNVGYEAYPMEVFIPGVIADLFSVGPGQKLSNLLALWSPNLFPGLAMNNPSEFSLDIVLWDGRERPFSASTGGHAIVRTLGNPIQVGQDQPTSIKSDFNVNSFVCDHIPPAAGIYENDGHPRSGTPADACSNTLTADDPTHTSDNLEVGDQLQSSTPLATWRFKLNRSGELPNFPPNLGIVTDNSGRGLVGVVLSAVTATVANPSTSFAGIGEAIRLWHKDPCELAQSGNNFGPPHLRDASLFILDVVGGPGIGGSAMTIFNALSLSNQADLCSLPSLVRDGGLLIENVDVNNFVGALTP
jgi:hypothetical protein